MKAWVWALALAVPMSAMALLGAQQTSSDDVRSLYIAKCSMCHGLDGTPKPIAKGAPKFTDPKWIRTVEQLEQIITSGKGKLMIGFEKRLSPKQIRALAEYVFSLKEGSE